MSNPAMQGATRAKSKLEGAIAELVHAFEQETGAHVVEVYYRRDEPRRHGEVRPLLSVVVEARVPDGDDRQRDLFNAGGDIGTTMAGGGGGN